jgi:hypothetical protein
VQHIDLRSVPGGRLHISEHKFKLSYVTMMTAGQTYTPQRSPRLGASCRVPFHHVHR